MKLHRNAKTTPTSRLELVRRTVDDVWRYQAVADGYGVSVRTVAKWVLCVSNSQFSRCIQA